MNLFDKFKMALSILSFKSNEKEFTADAWKRGMDLFGRSKDKGVTLPMKDSSIVYTCVSKISSNLPQAVLKFYRGEDELSVNDPIVDLFAIPNPFTNQAMFLEQSTMFFSLYGEVFWYLVKSKGQISGTRNLPSEMVVLNPKKMKEVIEDQKLVGWIWDGKLSLDLDEILHIKFPNPYSNLRGMSPIDGITADMDSDYLAGRYSKQFFVNGAAPQTVFTNHEDDETSEDQKSEFLKQWNALHRGVSNSHKAAMLSAGQGIKVIGLSQDEMNYVDSRQYSALRIMSAFSVPPPVAGDFTNANYSNIKVAKQMFWNETLQVYLRRYENMVNSFIVRPYDKTIKAKFDLTEVVELQKDAKDVSEVIAKYAGLGVPVNILAETYKLPFGNIEGLDTGYMPLNMVAVGTEETSDIKSEVIEVSKIKSIGSDRIEKGIRDQFLSDRAKSERLFKKELKKYLFNQQSKILSKLLGKKSTSAEVSVIMDRIDIWDQQDKNLVTRFTPVYVETAKMAGESALDNIGATGSFIVDKALIKDRVKILQGINNSTFISLNRIVGEGIEKGKSIEAIAKDIKGFYSHISKSRAPKIARTESASMINGQQAKTYKEKGVKQKRWIGGSVRDTHIAVSGTTIDINDSFSVGNDSLMYPGDPSGSAEETINCVCSLVPVVN